MLFLIQSLPKHKNVNHGDFLSLYSVKIPKFSIQDVTDVGLWNKFNIHIKLPLSYIAIPIYNYSPKIMDTEKDL